MEFSVSYVCPGCGCACGFRPDNPGVLCRPGCYCTICQCLVPQQHRKHNTAGTHSSDAAGLDADQVQVARAALNAGQPTERVAAAFHVSRATLDHHLTEEPGTT